MKRASTRASKEMRRPSVRAVGYCRQSVADQLEFHSVLAQADAIANYVACRASDGWTLLPTEFHDRGFSGGNTDRPGYQALLQAIEAGAIDVVVVHRLDRISRSLSDFVSFIALLDRHGVGFVAVTQCFDTTTSIGRLTMNLLGCFSEFERACISERTRAKFVAARQRGLWVTGRPPLGYDLVEGELVVNEQEAATANQIFALYLRCASLRATIDELDRLGIRTKLNTRKDGKHFGGSRFCKQVLAHMLANPVYVGQLRSGEEVLPGKHPAIVEQSVFDAVQTKLASNAVDGAHEARNKHHALLRGRVHCARCGAEMGHDFTRRHGRLYRFYVCQRARSKGADACPGSRCSAHDLEAFVVERIRGIGTDPRVLDAAIAAARAEADAQRPALISQVRRLEAEQRRLQKERDGLLSAAAEAPRDAGPALARTREIDGDLGSLGTRLTDARAELTAVEACTIDGGGLREQLQAFDALWDQLDTHEQVRLIGLLIESVRVDAVDGTLEIEFRGAPPKSAQESA